MARVVLFHFISRDADGAPRSRSVLKISGKGTIASCLPFWETPFVAVKYNTVCPIQDNKLPEARAVLLDVALVRESAVRATVGHNLNELNGEHTKGCILRDVWRTNWRSTAAVTSSKPLSMGLDSINRMA